MSGIFASEPYGEPTLLTGGKVIDRATYWRSDSARRWSFSSQREIPIGANGEATAQARNPKSAGLVSI
jgi:hypothetical protein